MAPGALPRQVLNMVLGEAASLSAAAVVMGMGASFIVTRFVKSMLFGITRPIRPRCGAPPRC